MRINFIRHGKTEANLSGRISGSRIDCPLSVQGISELEILRKHTLYPAQPGLCFTSDLLRTQQTMQTIYPGQPFTPTPLLRERDFGPIEWETDPEKIRQWRMERWNKDGTENSARYGDGETTPVFANRVQRDFSLFVTQLLKRHVSTVTVCGHGGFLRQLGTGFCVKGFENVKPAVLNGRGLIFEVSISDAAPFQITLAGYIGGNTLEEVVEQLPVTTPIRPTQTK